MNTLTEKLGAFEKRAAVEQGEFYVFALVVRDSNFIRWDLIVSASWLEQPGRPAVETITQFIAAELEPDELLELGRVVVLSPDNPLIAALGKLDVHHEERRYVDLKVDGFQFDLAVVFTATTTTDAEGVSPTAA